MYKLYCEWLENQTNQTTPGTALHGSSTDRPANASSSTSIADCGSVPTFGEDTPTADTACSASTPVSRRAYRDIFVRTFNYGFGSPRSDTCSLCDSRDTSETVQTHKQNASLAFEKQKVDRQLATANDDTAFITFDLQKTLPLPKLSTGISFYLRQLWLYNAGIHMITRKGQRAFFNIWTEADGKRGCEEIGSCLLAFIEDAGLGSGDRPCHLITWCDSCAGQNKNFFLLCLWQFLILTKNFSAIEQKFPETGHSFLDSDRDFAQVEKLVRKEENIYTVDKYANLMAESQKRNKPSVTYMTGKFVEIKQLPAKLGLFNNTSNTQGQAVKFRDRVKWIKVTAFGSYEYRESFDETSAWKSVSIRRCSEAVKSASIELASKKTTQGNNMVSSKKLADLAKQLKFIPSIYQPFYKNIIDKANGDPADSDCISDQAEDLDNYTAGAAASPSSSSVSVHQPQTTNKQNRRSSAGRKQAATSQHVTKQQVQYQQRETKGPKKSSPSAGRISTKKHSDTSSGRRRSSSRNASQHRTTHVPAKQCNSGAGPADALRSSNVSAKQHSRVTTTSKGTAAGRKRTAAATDTSVRAKKKAC